MSGEMDNNTIVTGDDNILLITMERSKRIWRYATKASISTEKRVYGASSKMCTVVLNRRWKGFSDLIWLTVTLRDTRDN